MKPSPAPAKRERCLERMHAWVRARVREDIAARKSGRIPRPAAVASRPSPPRA